MLNKRLVICAVLFLFSLGAVPVASGQMGPGKMDPEMRMKHHKAMGDLMEIVKETMDIVRNLSHVPGAAQKKRLTEMMNQLDEMIKKHEEMGEKRGM
jgi:hypothetical protein